MWGPLLVLLLSQAPDATRVELARLETVWNEAHVRGDAEALDRLWADDIVVTVPKMPVMGKAESLAIWRSGRMRFQRYDTSELGVPIYDNAAVVTGRVQRRRTMGEREAADDWRFTKVYVRRSGEWRVVAWHASETAPSR